MNPYPDMSQLMEELRVEQRIEAAGGEYCGAKWSSLDDVLRIAAGVGRELLFVEFAAKHVRRAMRGGDMERFLDELNASVDDLVAEVARHRYAGAVNVDGDGREVPA